MLAYDENRTQSIVNRLVTIGKVIKFIVNAIFVILFASIAFIFFLASSSIGGSQSFKIIGTIVGGVLGWFIGNYISSLVVVMIEWLAQMLVAIENLIAIQKR